MAKKINRRNFIKRTAISALAVSVMSRQGFAGNEFCNTETHSFVSLGKKSSVWWFKSPEGEQFLSIGVNHIEPVYWQSPNNREFAIKTYGPDLFSPEGAINEGSPAAGKWARRVATNFRSWGFNTFGFHNPLSESLHSASQAYYVVELGIPVPWNWNTPRTVLIQAFKKRPLDVFDDSFVAVVEANAKELVKPRTDDRQVLGYAYTDGPPWTVEDDRDAAILQKLTNAEKTIHPWVLAIMSQTAETKGKQAWLSIIKERYHSPQQAGATYACNVTTWNELASITEWTSVSDIPKAEDDSQAFLEKIMHRWYDVRKNAIRKYDGNHLILGDKLNMNRDSKFPEKLIRSLHIMKDYVDVINIQYYAPFSEQRATLALLYKNSQRPIISGDTACNPLWEDNPIENTGYYSKLGQTYSDHVLNLFSLPYFIGWHHCGYMRGLRTSYVEALKRGDQKSIEFYVKSKHTYREGFVTEFDEPIEPIVKPLSLAISNCERVHHDSGKHP